MPVELERRRHLQHRVAIARLRHHGQDPLLGHRGALFAELAKLALPVWVSGGETIRHENAGVHTAPSAGTVLSRHALILAWASLGQPCELGVAGSLGQPGGPVTWPRVI